MVLGQGGHKHQHLLPASQNNYCQIPQRTLDMWKLAHDSFKDGKAFLERGKREHSSGALLMSVDSFELAMKNGIKNPEIQKMLGDAYYHLAHLSISDGKCDAAESYLASAIGSYRDALKSFPKDFQAHLQLTWCFLLMEDYEHMFEHASAVLEVMPDHHAVRYARGTAAYELSREHRPDDLMYFNVAFEDLSACLKAGFHFSKTYEMLAEIYFARGEKDRAADFDDRAAIHGIAERNIADGRQSIN